MKDILYTVAKNKNGNLIKANDAEKGVEYFCPECGKKLILKKSGRIGEGSRRPHFAQKTLTPNCTPEKALHYSFKNLLFEKIQQQIISKTSLTISWHCKHCNDEHSGNLIKKIKKVKIEYDMKFCKPDIALFDNDDKVFAVIEVVDTHKPEENILKYYDENNIILIQINLKSDKDIDELENKIAHPDFVSTCYNPKCDICGHYLYKTKMTIIEGPCWNCHKPMKVVVINGGLEREGNSGGPSTFTIKEIEIARSNGVILKKHDSNTMQKKYLANTCANCGKFVGDFHLHDYEIPASLGELPSTTFDIGFYCSNCIQVKYAKN